MIPKQLPSMVLILSAWLVLATAHGAEPTAAGPGASNVDKPPSITGQSAKGELDPPYVDPSFGFSIAPPAGSTLYREKQSFGTADVQLCQFARSRDKWVLTVRHSTTKRPVDAETIFEGITSNLARKCKDLRVVRRDKAQIADRQGFRYAALSEQADYFRQQAIIRFQPTEYLTLVFATPLIDRQIAQKTFDKIVDSFQILRSEVKRKRIEAALVRGTRLLRQVGDGEIDLSVSVLRTADKPFTASHLRFVRDGEEIGFVQVLERKDTIDKHPGIQIVQSGWLFPEDGSISFMKQDAFLANDLSYERWENSVQMVSAAPSGSPRQVMTNMESGLRQDDKLLIKYTTLPMRNTTQRPEKVLQVEKSYASPIWQVLLPRVIDLAKPELYAFSTYSTDRRGIMLRTFEVIGPARVVIDGQTLPAIKIEDSEGLIPPISEIDVDDKGRILRVVAGPLEMLSTTHEYIERTYMSRINRARKLFKKHSRSPQSTQREKTARSRSQ